MTIEQGDTPTLHFHNDPGFAYEPAAVSVTDVDGRTVVADQPWDGYSPITLPGMATLPPGDYAIIIRDGYSTVTAGVITVAPMGETPR